MKKVLLLLAIMALTVSFCVGCGGNKADHTHAYTYSFVEGEAPTEEARGKVVGTCSVCGKTTSVALPALTDSLAWSCEETPATCIAAGEKVYTAKNFEGITIKIAGEAVNPDAHDFKEVAAKAATCAENGNIAYKICNRCEKIFVGDEEKTLADVTLTAAHTFVDVPAVAATCLNNGTKAHKHCSVCEKDFIDGVEVSAETLKIAATGHTEVIDAAVPATCTEDGKTEGKHCSVCNAVLIKQEVVPKKGHTKVIDAAVPATCTKDGKTEGKHCSVCGEVLIAQEVVPATGHTEVIDAAVEATCSKPGKTEGKHCSVCGEVLVKQQTVVASHKFVNGKCSNCGMANSYGAVIFYAYAESGISPSGTNRLVLDASGLGDDVFLHTGDSYRNATIKIEIIDDVTGRVRITAVYEKKTSSGWGYDDEPSYGPSEDEYETITEYRYGYLDKASGIIVSGYSASEDGTDPNFTGVRLFIPVGATESITASSVVTSDTSKISVGAAKPYTCVVGGNSYNFFVENGKIYFGVRFVDLNGEALSASDMKTASVFRVVNAEGEIIASYGAADGAIFPLDGHEGNYTADEVNVVVNGAGKIVYGESEGTYTTVSDNVIAASFKDGEKVTAYYEITLNADGTASVVKPMVTVTLVSEYNLDGGKTAQVNKNTAYAPEALANTEEMVFCGWTYTDGDKTITLAVGDELVVTGDITLTAVWKELTVITVIDNGYEGNKILGDKTIRANAGDVLYEILVEKYGMEYKGELGYFAVASFMVGDVELEESAVIGEEDTAITVNVVWEKVPDYVGTYYGSEMWYKNSGNRGGSTLTIAKDGTISGYKTGHVVSYDEATQKVVWNNGKADLAFYFDKQAKIILGIYKDNDILNDYYFFGQDVGPDGKAVANYGVFVNKYGSSSDYGYYAQFIEAKTALGDNTVIFTYNNVIYSGVTIVNAFGESLKVKSTEANSIDKSATVLVYKDGVLIYARAAAAGKTIGDSTSSSNPTRELDAYFGTYTCDGADDLMFDGLGTFVWGEKSGVYAINDDGMFDLYVQKNGVNVEYYTAVIDTDTKEYISEKPMVEISFESDITPDEDFIASVTVNKNISYKLPVYTTATQVVSGWYVKGDETQTVVTSIAPDAAATYVAKWVNKKVLTIVYGNGLENLTVSFATGASVTLADYIPEDANGKTFSYWYESADGGVTELAKYTASTVSDDITLYVMWADRFDAEGSGTGLEIWSASSVSGSKNITVANGVFSGSKSGTVTDYIKSKGTFVLVNGSSKYCGYYEAATGAIAVNYNVSDGLGSDTYLFFIGKTKNIELVSSLAYDSNKTRILTLKHDGEQFVVVMRDNKIYAYVNVLVSDISGSDIKRAIVTRDGNVLTVFGINGTTTVAASEIPASDGYTGTYIANVLGSFILDGVGGFTCGDVTGFYAINGNSISFDTIDYVYTIDVEAKTMTVVTDGFEGSYTLDGDETPFVLDGLGKYTHGAENGTYTVSNSLVKLDNGAKYKADVENGTFTLFTNPFAGLVFNGTYLEWGEDSTKVTLKFNSGNEISGTLTTGSYVYEFVAELVDTTLTFTFTNEGAPGQAAKGKTLIGKVSGSKITFAKGTYSPSNVYTFWDHGSVTCEGFSM